MLDLGIHFLSSKVLSEAVRRGWTANVTKQVSKDNHTVSPILKTVQEKISLCQWTSGFQIGI